MLQQSTLIPGFSQVFPGFRSQLYRLRPLNLGRMDVICGSCGALHWLSERDHGSTKARPTFMKCCKRGDVVLPDVLNPPLARQQLFTCSDPAAQNFRENIGAYNGALAFTSVNCHETGCGTGGVVPVK